MLIEKCRYTVWHFTLFECNVVVDIKFNISSNCEMGHSDWVVFLSLTGTVFFYFQDVVHEQLNNIVSASPEDTLFFAPFRNPPSSVDAAVM